MHRYKIVIQYDGSFFRGWQLQKNQKTVQGDIENALMTIARSKSRIIVKGSGRTDAGVHAIGQVAHFDLDSKLTDRELLRAINARLDKEIRVSQLTKVSENFHSRFDAISKKYHYLCSLSDNPLNLKDHFQVKNIDFDLDSWNQALKDSKLL